MYSRHKILALLLCAVLFALAPLGVSAATREAAARQTRLAPAVVAAAFANGLTVPVTGTLARSEKRSWRRS